MNELINRKDSLYKQMQSILDKATVAKRDLFPIEIKQFDKLQEEFDGVVATINASKSLEQRSKESLKAMLYQNNAEYRDAFMAKLNNRDNQTHSLLLKKEQRALSAIVGSSGGYTVPSEMTADIFSALAINDPVRSVATVLPTPTGVLLNWPTADDSANEGVILGESSSVGSSVDPTFATLPLKAYKYSSKLILVPMELMQDSGYRIANYLPPMCGKRVAKIQNKHFTNGTGTGQPKGLVTSATSGKVGTTGQTLTVTYDDLIDLIYSVDPAYRANAKWMFADTTAKIIRKLKDTAGQPIWQASTQPGNPDMLLGYPVIANNQVPAMAASAKSILFGDFKQYVIRDVAKIEMTILNERYADSGQVGCFTFVRSDGQLLDSNAVKYYQNSAT